MVRPARFGFNNETASSNAFQQAPKRGEAAQKIQTLALKEFDNFVQSLKEKGIQVLVMPDSVDPPKPDAIFPNNWFCSLPSGELVIFPMQAPNRREEKSDEILQRICKAFQVKDVEDWSEYEAENFFLEGTGSMIFDHEHKTVYACLSARTHKALFERFARAHGYRPIHFEALDEKGQPIYHTNVMMHIGQTYAVICLEAIKNKAERIRIAQELQSSDHEIIEISLSQVHQFAGNMLQVAGRQAEPFTIMSQTAFDSLTADQKQVLAIHSTLLPVAIPTIENIGGGSARCMIAEIFQDKKH